jgi:type I restriction enzyme S subunit
MVWNDELKRDVPEGWEVVRLETISNIFDSKRIPLSSMEREKMKGIYPYYGATGIFDYIDEYIFDGNYILIAEDGSVMGDDGLAIVQYIWGKTWVNNHAHVLQHKELENNEYLFYVLKSISVVQVMTGSIQKKINQENLMNVKIALPDNKTLKLFSEFTEPMRQKIINIIEENKTLSELRDWLLPMLMNGQVRVDI